MGDGRRCLAGTPTARFAEPRRRLGSLGAAAHLLAALAAAMDADYILGHALATDPDRIKPATHPLGHWVLTRSISEMLAWPFTGQLPTALQGVSQPSRRGPVAVLPTLSPAERRTSWTTTALLPSTRCSGATALTWVESFCAAGATSPVVEVVRRHLHPPGTSGGATHRD
jgi:hypothetical protein